MVLLPQNRSKGRPKFLIEKYVLSRPIHLDVDEVPWSTYIFIESLG